MTHTKLLILGTIATTIMIHESSDRFCTMNDHMEMKQGFGCICAGMQFLTMERTGGSNTNVTQTKIVPLINMHNKTKSM